jgi:hypothetical protein
MKSFIIWLDCGECIEGNAEEIDIVELIHKWKTGTGGQEKLVDSEGYTFINLSKVQAIAVNDIADSKPVGFIKEA